MKQQIRFGKSVIPYTVAKSRRRKTSQIIVDGSGVTVQTPATKKDSEIRRMVSSKREWIYKKQLQFRDKKRQRNQHLYESVLPYFGKDHELVVLENSDTDKVTLSKNQFTVKLKGNSTKTRIKNLYVEWIKQKAPSYLVPRTKKLSQKTGITPSRIVIKNLRSRWGSATKTKTINLNSNLLLLSKDLIDYVIIHELCHLIIPSHSYRYWNLLSKYSKNYKMHVDSLNDACF